MKFDLAAHDVGYYGGYDVFQTGQLTGGVTTITQLTSIDGGPYMFRIGASCDPPLMSVTGGAPLTGPTFGWSFSIS